MNGNEITYSIEMIKKGITSRGPAGRIAAGRFKLRGKVWVYALLGWLQLVAIGAGIVGLIKLIC